MRLETFKELYPNSKNTEELVQSLNKLLPEYDINTNKRISAFISQCGHESGGWRVFEENLNYSAKALNIVFPKYFKYSNRNAENYHRNPQKIANIVYANRMGNGNSDSNDGWNYRGRGAIQITGKNNYTKLSEYLDIDCVNNPDMICETDYIILSALWFWKENDLNNYVDNNDIKGLSKRINGGYNGLEDRLKYYNKVLQAISTEPELEVANIGADTYTPLNYGMLRRGSIGEGVELIQELLGLTADGKFGPGTERAVISWQKDNGLIPDGIVGPKTLNKMLE